MKLLNKYDVAGQPGTWTSIPIIAPSLRVKKEAENLGFTDVYNVESANVTDVSTFVKEFLAAH